MVKRGVNGQWWIYYKGKIPIFTNQPQQDLLKRVENRSNGKKAFDPQRYFIKRGVDEKYFFQTGGKLWGWFIF